MLKSKLLILIPIALLAACGTTQPVVKIVTQQVEVPVAIACKAVTPVPPIFNFDILTEDRDIYDKSRAILADRKLHLGYEAELLAALKSCQ